MLLFDSELSADKSDLAHGLYNVRIEASSANFQPR